MSERSSTPLDDVRSVLTELLRLYDWRFKLADEEKMLLGQAPTEDEWRARQKALKSDLKLYGEQKKTAWIAARRVLFAVPSETALTDEKGRPMTYWGGVAPSAEGARSENADMWRLHAQSFDAFLGELYAIMVDPCAEGTIKRDDMMQALKDAAVRDREASEKHQSDPKNINLAALVLKFNKHISLHEMFASEWEAIVAAARAMPSATVNATASTTAKR